MWSHMDCTYARGDSHEEVRFYGNNEKHERSRYKALTKKLKDKIVSFSQRRYDT